MAIILIISSWFYLVRMTNSRQDVHSHKLSTPSVGSVSGASSKSQVEPSVDFELDIKVDIDMGKCTLHPKESRPEGEGETKK